MKKILCLSVVLILLLITSCGGYPAVESTDEENTVLFSITVADSRYDVKYELYRALFLNYKADVDGGDDSVWSGEDSAEYIEKINEIILPMIANIYATINLAESIGIDFSSKKVKKQVDELIEISIEGGSYNGRLVEGAGSYDEYLASLKAANHNYSTQILLYHYAIAQTEIAKYYIGTLSEDNITPDATEGHLEYTEEDIRAFYDSDDCVRILRAFAQIISGDLSEAKQRAESIREEMLDAAPHTNEVSAAIIGNTMMSYEEAYGGMLVGKHSLDENIYADFTDTAFSLDIGEVSECLKILTGDENGYHILYRAEKTDDYFEDYYLDVVNAYVNNKIGEMIYTRTQALISGIEYKDSYSELSHKDISMN